ncbi:MAG: hypothetical protein ACREMA_17095 [Longimicrobiales bacterium]
MHEADRAIEEQLDVIVVDGQRCEVWVRSEPADDGTWHNALVFRRAGGRTTAHEELVTGLEWHVPPGIALERARELGENEQAALFRRALQPRTPLV